MQATATKSRTPYRILVVDDEQAVLELIGDIVQQAGWDTVLVASPLEALQRIKRSRFDALILDLYMPELPGMLLHAKLKLLDRPLADRTIFVSGHFSRAELEQELESHAILLQKPFTPSELVTLVERVLPAKPSSVTA